MFFQLTCSLKRQTSSSYHGIRPSKVVGTFIPSDGVEEMKRKIGIAYGMNMPLPLHTQLLHKNAEVDSSLFTSLASFLEWLPSPLPEATYFHWVSLLIMKQKRSRKFVVCMLSHSDYNCIC